MKWNKRKTSSINCAGKIGYQDAKKNETGFIGQN